MVQSAISAGGNRVDGGAKNNNFFDDEINERAMKEEAHRSRHFRV
jgi:hypothetical protein